MCVVPSLDQADRFGKRLDGEKARLELKNAGMLACADDNGPKFPDQVLGQPNSSVGSQCEVESCHEWICIGILLGFMEDSIR